MTMKKNNNDEVYILGTGTESESETGMGMEFGTGTGTAFGTESGTESEQHNKKEAKRNVFDKQASSGQTCLDDAAARKRLMRWNLWIIGCILLTLIVGLTIYLFNSKEEAPEYYFEPEQTAETTSQSVSVIAPESGHNEAETAFIEVTEEVAGTVALLVYTPHHATMSLTIGMPDKSDTTIVFAAMAADIRKDNMQIVGDFVLAGKQLARGSAKKGYAAIIDNKITLGVGTSTPLLQEALERNGSFFRQYPLVHDSEPVENKPKNKSIRRALAARNGQIIMVESTTRLSFHEFSQALITIGVTEAIYLVGSDAYGWYRNKEHSRQEFGKELTDIPENISYILWR